MDITQVSIIHHIALVLLGLWVVTSLGWAHPALFFVSLLYLYMVSFLLPCFKYFFVGFHVEVGVPMPNLFVSVFGFVLLNHFVGFVSKFDFFSGQFLCDLFQYQCPSCLFLYLVCFKIQVFSS